MRPQDEQYSALREQLGRYRTLAPGGGECATDLGLAATLDELAELREPELDE
jgi:hypothetical protein